LSDVQYELPTQRAIYQSCFLASLDYYSVREIENGSIKQPNLGGGASLRDWFGGCLAACEGSVPEAS